METWRRDLYVLLGGVFILSLGFQMATPFLPLYLEELGAQGGSVELWTGAIISIHYVMMTVSTPIWGALSDRVGRKPMMLRSTLSMAVVVSLMGLVSAPWQLFLLRFFQGVSAGFNPAVQAYVAAAAPTDKKGWALGLVTMSQITGNVLGPLFGGVMSQIIGYRPLFLFTGVSCLISALVVILLIREKHEPMRQKMEVGLLRDLKILSGYPVVVTVALIYFFYMFGIWTVDPLLSRYLRLLNAPESMLQTFSGVALSITGVATIFMAPLVGRLSDRLGARPVLTVCLTGAALIYLAQGMASTVWQLLFCRFLLGLFIGGLIPTANAMVARLVPPQMQGRAFGVTNSAYFAGNTVGPIVGGVIAARIGLWAVFPVASALFMINLSWVLVRTRSKPPGADSAN